MSDLLAMFLYIWFITPRLRAFTMQLRKGKPFRFACCSRARLMQYKGWSDSCWNPDKAVFSGDLSCYRHFYSDELHA